MDFEIMGDAREDFNAYMDNQESDGFPCSIHPKWWCEKITDCPECFPDDGEDYMSPMEWRKRDEEDGSGWDEFSDEIQEGF